MDVILFLLPGVITVFVSFALGVGLTACFYIKRVDSMARTLAHNAMETSQVSVESLTPAEEVAVLRARDGKAA